jgi:hypothetical protein
LRSAHVLALDAEVASEPVKSIRVRNCPRLLLTAFAYVVAGAPAGCHREVEVYPIVCEGKVVRNLCLGKLGVPGNPSSFVHSQTARTAAGGSTNVTVDVMGG